MDERSRKGELWEIPICWLNGGGSILKYGDCDENLDELLGADKACLDMDETGWRSEWQRSEAWAHPTDYGPTDPTPRTIATRGDAVCFIAGPQEEGGSADLIECGGDLWGELEDGSPAAMSGLTSTDAGFRFQTSFLQLQEISISSRMVCAAGNSADSATVVCLGKDEAGFWNYHHRPDSGQGETPWTNPAHPKQGWAVGRDWLCGIMEERAVCLDGRRGSELPSPTMGKPLALAADEDRLCAVARLEEEWRLQCWDRIGDGWSEPQVCGRADSWNQPRLHITCMEGSLGDPEADCTTPQDQSLCVEDGWNFVCHRCDAGVDYVQGIDDPSGWTEWSASPVAVQEAWIITTLRELDSRDLGTGPASL